MQAHSMRISTIIYNVLGWLYYLPVALFNLLKILLVSFEHVADATGKSQQSDDPDKDLNTRLINDELDNPKYGRLRKEYARLDFALKKMFFWNPNAGIRKPTDPKVQAALNAARSKSDPLKEKGDAYERFIGLQFEKKGDLVIYNGLINGYSDHGVDLIAISAQTRTLNLIQCKNWERMPLTVDGIAEIYARLDRYNIGHYLMLECDTINYYLGSPMEHRDILTLLHDSKQFRLRKTLYLSSDKSVDLAVGQHLVMIAPDIFRYKDMKMVIRPMPS